MAILISRFASEIEHSLPCAARDETRRAPPVAGELIGKSLSEEEYLKLAKAINRSTCWRFVFEWREWKTRETDKQQCLVTLASWFAAHDDKCEKMDDWNGLTVWVWSKAAATQLRMMANEYAPIVNKTTRPNFHLLPDKPFQFEMKDIYTIPYTVQVSERTAERATAKFWELWRTDSHPRSRRPAGMPENAKMFSDVGDGKPKPSEEAPKTK